MPTWPANFSEESDSGGARGLPFGGRRRSGRPRPPRTEAPGFCPSYFDPTCICCAPSPCGGVMKGHAFILLLVFLCTSFSLSAGKTKQAGSQTSGVSATVPTLRYATYLGRTSADMGSGIMLGADGSIYVAGVAAPTAASGHNEAFVAHLSADGSTVLYVAYLGGDDDTEAKA